MVLGVLTLRLLGRVGKPLEMAAEDNACSRQLGCQKPVGLLSPGKELVSLQPMWRGWWVSGCTQERSLAHIPLLSLWDWACSLEVPLCCRLIKPNRTLGKKQNKTTN